MKEIRFVSLLLIISLAIAGLLVAFGQARNASKSEPIPVSNRSTTTSQHHVYTDSTKRFSLEYPEELEAFAYSNDVVGFFKQEDIENCKKFQETQNPTLQDACYKSVFNLTGFEVLSQKDYQKELSSKKSPDIYAPKVIMDSQNRSWNTFQSLGEGSNFDAYTIYKDRYVGVHFQSHADKRDFFDQILSTVVILF